MNGVSLMRWPDIAVLIVFMVGMAAMGVYFARKNEKTSEEYFLGNRSFPGWAVGLSMAGTALSSVTFLALPASTYVLDMRFAMQYAAYPVIVIFTVWLIIPFFRSGRITSAYEYLEHKFGLPIRLYTSASFAVMQLVRLAVVLYLMALPVGQLCGGLPIVWVIIISGVVVMLYTGYGGIAAVIWTDVIQTIILFAGALICLVTVVWEVPGGLGTVIDVGYVNGKFSLGSLQFGFGERTMWVMLLIGFIGFLGGSMADQTMVQRYLAASSTREARKAAIVSAVSSIFTWMLFLFIGICMFVYFKVLPDPNVAKLNPEEVLPYYILTRIPSGLAGIIIAAILAAGLSTLSSGINSISTVAVVDFLKRCISRDRPDEYYFYQARLISFAVGVIMIAGALIFHYLPRESMSDLSLIIGSLFGGCSMAIFLAVFFVCKIDAKAATAGLIGALLLNIYLMLCAFGALPEHMVWHLHSYLVSVAVNVAFFIFAFLSLIVRKAPRHD